MAVQIVDEVFGHLNQVAHAYYVDKESVFITGSEDQSLRLWVKRENGTNYWSNYHACHFSVDMAGVWWPCAIQYLESGVSCFHFDYSTRHLVVGTALGQVLLYTIPKDYNSLDLVAHSARVSGAAVDVVNGFIISCGADGAVQLHELATRRLVGTHSSQAVFHCLQYIPSLKMAFVGASTGEVLGLAVSETSLTARLAFSGHKSNVRGLCWSEKQSLLFSSGQDGIVCVWHLQAHKELSRSIMSLIFKSTEDKNQLVSLDTSGKVVIWDMSVERQTAPQWQESDTCELCSRPFFWNVQKSKTQLLGFNLPKFNSTRQHHCRLCGRACCGDCVPRKMSVSSYGFEAPVYVCTTCIGTVRPEDNRATTKTLEIKRAASLKWVSGTDMFIETDKDFGAKTVRIPR